MKTEGLLFTLVAAALVYFFLQRSGSCAAGLVAGETIGGQPTCLPSGTIS